VSGVREENASSVSPSLARASHGLGKVNKTFVVIGELNSMTHYFCSLKVKGNVGFSRAISQGIGPERIWEGSVGLDDSKDFENPIIHAVMNYIGAIMRRTFLKAPREIQSNVLYCYGRRRGMYRHVGAVVY